MMICVIETDCKTIRVMVQNDKSVPDMLKTCKALGFEPIRWYLDNV